MAFCNLNTPKGILKSQFAMGTLKSVCSSWFALISRDKYEHTHLRVPISKVRFIYSNFDVFSVTPMQFSAIHVPRSQNEDQALFSRVFKIYSLKTYLREGTFPSLFLFDFQFRFCNDIQQQHLCPWKRCSDLIFVATQSKPKLSAKTFQNYFV